MARTRSIAPGEMVVINLYEYGVQLRILSWVPPAKITMWIDACREVLVSELSRYDFELIARRLIDSATRHEAAIALWPSVEDHPEEGVSVDMIEEIELKTRIESKVNAMMLAQIALDSVAISYHGDPLAHPRSKTSQIYRDEYRCAARVLFNDFFSDLEVDLQNGYATGTYWPGQNLLVANGVSYRIPSIETAFSMLESIAESRRARGLKEYQESTQPHSGSTFSTIG